MKRNRDTEIIAEFIPLIESHILKNRIEMRDEIYPVNKQHFHELYRKLKLKIDNLPEAELIGALERRHYIPENWLRVFESAPNDRYIVFNSAKIKAYTISYTNLLVADKLKKKNEWAETNRRLAEIRDKEFRAESIWMSAHTVYVEDKNIKWTWEEYWDVLLIMKRALKVYKDEAFHCELEGKKTLTMKDNYILLARAFEKRAKKEGYISFLFHEAWRYHIDSEAKTTLRNKIAIYLQNMFPNPKRMSHVSFPPYCQ